MTTASPQNTQDDNAITNAGAVIDRFGGIRPMAAKMNVPVTTVQGWKKRDVIPGNRRDDIINAARAHGIDLGGLTGAPVSAPPVSPPPYIQPQATQPAAPGVSRDTMMNQFRIFEKQAVRSSVMAASAILIVFFAVSGVLIAVGKKSLDQTETRVAALENDVAQVRTAEPGDPGKAAQWAQDLGRQIASLKSDAEGLKTRVDDLKMQAETIVQEIQTADLAGLMGRLGALEQMVAQMNGGSPELADMLGRLRDMQGTIEGQAQLQNSLTDLRGLVEGLQGRMGDMDAKLAEEQKCDSALGQTLQGVSPADLKAAALLLGLTQVRESAAREQPFYDDLQMLKTMLGEDDPELNAAIDRLAPLAQQGVLSPDGLSGELRGLTGDIVVSSLKGEDVSIKDKAMARLNEVVQIQKDGEMITGTDTQARVARAQSMLDDGDVEGALAELQALQGPAAETAQPIIDQAQMTLMAQELQSVLTDGVMKSIKGARSRVPYTAGGGAGAVFGPSEPVMMP